MHTIFPELLIQWLTSGTGSFPDFPPILSILNDKYKSDTLPRHFIVPSLLVYAFSSPPPLNRIFDLQDVARLLNRLMILIGLGKSYGMRYKADQLN